MATTESTPQSNAATDTALLDMLNGRPAAKTGGKPDEGTGDEKTGNGTTDPATFTQADIDRIIAERLRRDRSANAAEIADLRERATRLDQLEAQHLSEQEKAVREAERRGESAASARFGERLVTAYIDAAVTGGRLTREGADVLLGGLDAKRFLADSGDVDTERVEKLISAFAPAAPKTTPPAFPDLGQGRRTSSPASTADQFAAAVEGFFQ